MKTAPKFIVLILTLPLGFLNAQINSDTLRSIARKTAVKTLNHYYSFATSGRTSDLVSGIASAAQTKLIIETRINYFPKSMQRQETDKAIEALDRLSGDVAVAFSNNPSSVRRDPGFVIFIHGTRIALERILGDLEGVIE